MHVRVQLPARDEAPTLEAVVRRALLALDTLADDTTRTSVLVLDDASRDDTRAIALSLAAEDARLQVLSLPASRGVGHAFRAGLERALADGVDVLVNLDADGQFDAMDVLPIVRPLLEGHADLVTASRFLGVKPSPPIPAVRAFGNHVLAGVVSALAGRRISDACCGLRAFSRRALEIMRLCEDFTYTQETLLQCAWAGLRFEEVPVLVRGTRAVGRSRVASSVVRYGVRVAGILARSWPRRHRFRAHAERPELWLTEPAPLLEDHRSL